MTIQAGAYQVIEPSFMESELLIQYSQASGFVDTLADAQLRTRIAEDDLLVYMRQINIRTKMSAGTASFNELPGVDISTAQISTPTYLLKVRSQYDHHDVQAGARWGFAVPEAYRLGMRQANFQLARDAALHGLNPQNGEGLVNASGATSVILPPDSYGNDSISTYDNGQMAFFLAQAFGQIKNRTVQLGIGRKFTIIGPQRALEQWQYNIVQLVQYQRPGAGSTSTAGTVKDILMANGDEVIWAYDDTLQGAGLGGADQIMIVMPEVAKPNGGAINTNAFAGLSPGSSVCTTQYCDMAAPREIISPLAAGATDFVMEWRITSGWAPRSTAITVINMQY